MSRIPFNFKDLEKECMIETACYQLDGADVGVKIQVPPALYNQYPYNASAYAFLQQLRSQIHEYGLVELPNLPLNKMNHTLAQRAPQEHAYSTNTYLTDLCQSPHQDTPPWPTAFWLGEPRKYFATWVLTIKAVEDFFDFSRSNPAMSIEEIHQHQVPQSIANGTGIIVNRSPGLLLIDNSHHRSLYHARTCQFDAVEADPNYSSDAPMYAYNEVGLLNYIDMLDSRRGPDDRDPLDLEEMKDFMNTERQHP